MMKIKPLSTKKVERLFQNINKKIITFLYFLAQKTS